MVATEGMPIDINKRALETMLLPAPEVLVNNARSLDRSCHLTLQTNFFEKRVGEYSKAGVGGSAEGNKFTLDEDF